MPNGMVRKLFIIAINQFQFVKLFQGALLYTYCVYRAMFNFALQERLPLHKGAWGAPALLQQTKADL